MSYHQLRFEDDPRNGSPPDQEPSESSITRLKPSEHHFQTGDRVSDGGSAAQTDSETPQIAASKTAIRSRGCDIVRLWGLEISVLFLALGLLVAMALILNGHNHKRLPNWGTTINLNALIAVLSTMFRASIAFVAFEVISQLKWQWLSTRTRSVRDLQLFDDASRGVYGSLRLTPLVVMQQPLALVAIVVVTISLAIGPFLQQTIQTYQCLQRVEGAGVDEASIQTAHGIDTNLWNTVGQSLLVYMLSNKMQAAMQDAVVNPYLSSNIESLFTCGTGHCSFPAHINEGESYEEDRISHASLGMCSRCEDTRELVNGPFEDEIGRRNEFHFGIPAKAQEDDTGNSYARVVLGETMQPEYLGIERNYNLSWAENAISNDLLVRSKWSLANFSIIAASQVPCERHGDTFNCPDDGWVNGCGNASYVAATCIIYPCLRYYRATVEGSKLSEVDVRDVPLIPQVRGEEWPLEVPYWWKAVQQPCIINGTLYTSGNMSKAPEEPRETVLALSHDFASIKPGKGSGYTNLTAPSDCVFKLRSPFTDALKWDLIRQFNVRCPVIGPMGTSLWCENTAQKEDYPFLSSLRDNCTTDFSSIRDRINSLTMRITREMRLAAWGPYHDNATGAAVQGEMWENTLCLKVSWEWLILPAILCVICVILLVWILIKSSRDRALAWKSSLVPFLMKSETGIWTFGLSGIQKTISEYYVRLTGHSEDGSLEVYRKVDEIQMNNRTAMSREAES